MNNTERALLENAKVISQTRLLENVWCIEFSSPKIAARARPGQFVMLRLPDGSRLLRRPFGVARLDAANGSFSVFYRTVGAGTRELSMLAQGVAISLLGPLGRGFDTSFSHPLLVGGGMGLAPLLFYAQVKSGHTDILMGGKTARELFWQSYFAPHVRDAFVTTDDGSLGEKGVATSRLPRLLFENDYDGIIACGPEAMMREAAKIAKQFDIRSQVSLERRMACGLGACLACSIDAADGSRKKVCKDGPVFWAEELPV